MKIIFGRQTVKNSLRFLRERQLLNATSTNTNIFEYNLETGKTISRLKKKKSRLHFRSQFSPSGDLTWLQMKRWL
jgi:hypothetical protein